MANRQEMVFYDADGRETSREDAVRVEVFVLSEDNEILEQRFFAVEGVDPRVAGEVNRGDR